MGHNHAKSRTLKRELEAVFPIGDHMNDRDCVGYSIFGTRVKEPDISVMIPTYKRPELLRRAVSSALGQCTSYTIEVVIVDNNDDEDDCANAGILDEFSDSRLSYVRNAANIGMFGNMNRCLSLANSAWVLILHDDDELRPDYVQTMLNVGKRIGNCGAVTCLNERIDAEGHVAAENKLSRYERFAFEKILQVTYTDFYVTHPAFIYGCLINRDAALSIGGFDDEYYPCSDAVFLFNICIRCGLYTYNKRLFRYRWAVNTSLKPEIQKDFARFEELKRRRINAAVELLPSFIDKWYRNCSIDAFIQDEKHRNPPGLSSLEIAEFKGSLGLNKSFKKRNVLARKLVLRLHKVLLLTRMER